MSITFKKNEVNIHSSSSPYSLGNLTQSQILQDDNIDDEVVNQLDIADGLKDMLVRRGFKLESVLSMRPGDLAETLGIDEYVAKIIMDSATAIVTIKKLKPKLCII